MDNNLRLNSKEESDRLSEMIFAKLSSMGSSEILSISEQITQIRRGRDPVALNEALFVVLELDEEPIKKPRVLLALAALSVGPEGRDDIWNGLCERYVKDVLKYGWVEAKLFLARDVAAAYKDFGKMVLRYGIVKLGKYAGIYQVIKRYFFGS